MRKYDKDERQVDGARGRSGNDQKKRDQPSIRETIGATHSDVASQIILDDHKGRVAEET